MVSPDSINQAFCLYSVTHWPFVLEELLCVFMKTKALTQLPSPYPVLRSSYGHHAHRVLGKQSRPYPSFYGFISE